MGRVRKTYKGIPITRSKRVPGGIQLVLGNKRPGDVHKRIVISQADWDKHVVTTILPRKD